MMPSTNTQNSLQPFSNFSHNTTNNIGQSVPSNNAASNSSNSSVSLNSQAYQQLLLAISQNSQLSGICNNNSNAVTTHNTNDNPNFNLLQQTTLFQQQQQPQSMFPQSLLQSSQQQSLSQFLAQSSGINSQMNSNLQSQSQLPQQDNFCPSSTSSSQISGCLPQLFNSLQNPFQLPMLPQSSNPNSTTSAVDMLQLFQMSLQFQQTLQQQQIQNQQLQQQFNIQSAHTQLSQQQSIPQLLFNTSFQTNLGSSNNMILPFDDNTLLFLKNSLIPNNNTELINLPFQTINNDPMNNSNILGKSIQQTQQQQSQNFVSSGFSPASTETKALHNKLQQLGITNDPLHARIVPKEEPLIHPEAKLENLTNIPGMSSLKATLQHVSSQKFEVDEQQSTFYLNKKTLLNNKSSNGLISGGGSEKTIILTNNKLFTQQSQQCLESKQEEIEKREEEIIQKNKENTSQNYKNEDGKLNQSYQSHNSNNNTNNTASQISNYEKKISKKSKEEEEESEYDYDEEQEESEWDEEDNSKLLKKRKRNQQGYHNYRLEKQTQFKTKEESNSSEGRIKLRSDQLGSIKEYTDREDYQNGQRDVSSLSQQQLHQQCNMLLEDNNLLEAMPLRKALNCVLSAMHPNADELTNFENKFVNSMKARQSKDKRNPNALYMTRFHNLTRLLMYNIVQLFNNETLSRTLCLPQGIAQSLETICKNIKHHARQTCNGQFKTDFYTHSHYNGLFLFLDNHTISHLRKSSKDIEIHKKVYNLDIEQIPVPEIQLKKTNFLKLLAYEILAKCSENNAQIIDGDDARRIYFRRALSGIAKLSTGQVVHRF